MWIQAHGHAQLFGWIGTFILGIGFYSIPNLRKMSSTNLLAGWICLLLWTSGAALRWYAAVSGIAWQILLPLSAMLEASAVSLFVWKTVQGSIQKKSKKGTQPWAILLISGTLVWLTLMMINLQMMIGISLHAVSPFVPIESGRRFLYAAVWGWVVPTVWGLSARWLPALLGISQPNGILLRLAAMANIIAITMYAFQIAIFPESIILLSSIALVYGLRLFAPCDAAAKINGVHHSFPVFVRVAYLWLLFSAVLFLAGAIFPAAAGTGGAARHAITVGFFSTMVFNIGPRLLPAFTGRKKLFSEGLMFASSLILCLGCLLRVISEILAYDFSVELCWQLLPVSAIIELTAMGLFAINILVTLWKKPLMDELASAKTA